jgi:hypothetical protein
MQQLPRSVAEHSRALFFFSGHGLEVHQDQQILLLSDYLKPPQRNWNKALSTKTQISHENWGIDYRKTDSA